MSELKSAYFNWFSLLIISYGLFIFISAFWAPSFSLGRIAVGAKFDYGLFIALLAGMSFGALNKDELIKLFRSFFFGASLAILLGLLLHFFLGPENFTLFGYSNEWSNYLANRGLSFCQKIEMLSLCRFQGTFSGPNQAGMFILLYFPIGIYFLFKNLGSKYKRVLISASLLLSVIALILTFSRSAWIGFFIELILITWIMFKGKPRVAIIGTLLLSAGVFATVMISLFPQTVLRPLSNYEHLDKWLNGLVTFSHSPIIGQGVGEAGPASRVVGSAELIPESWFLQVAIEYGIIGLALFGAIYIMILIKLWSMNDKLSKLLMIVFVSLIIPAQLLHIFEDSVMSYSLMLLTGAIFIKEKEPIS